MSLISREAAINTVFSMLCKWDMKDPEDLKNMLLKAFQEMPSAQPERKTGKWIYGENDCQDGWFCSACGEFIPWDYDYYGSDCDFIRDFKTCPFCDTKMVSYTGADMRGEEFCIAVTKRRFGEKGADDDLPKRKRQVGEEPD